MYDKLVELFSEEENKYAPYFINEYNNIMQYSLSQRLIVVPLQQISVVQKVDNAMNRRNRYQVDENEQVLLSYPVDSDLSNG